MLNRLFLASCLAGALSAQAAPEQAVLNIKGMDCAACPITVKTVLKKQSGVEDVKVDAQRHTAEVKFDSARVSSEKLARIVTEAGFPAIVQK